ncbi:hypothetical protein BaRGS_00020848 [Batillaria attramentaria]|uniref:Uncharacterized protein n=1 Tax=Batillaria attramentaria TaxID=370345 RepID=A0ABD0KM25_9CAEN
MFLASNGCWGGGVLGWLGGGDGDLADIHWLNDADKASDKLLVIVWIISQGKKESVSKNRLQEVHTPKNGHAA